MFSVTRDDLATAVTGTYDGVKVKGYDKRPSVLAPGAAWSVVESIERGMGDAFQVTWNVIVVLSGDEATALDQIGSVLPGLTAAIEAADAGYVDGAVPISYQSSAGELFALQINVRSE